MDLTKSATRVLRSWLDACNIEYGIEDGSVILNGKRIDIFPHMKALNSTDLDAGLAAFHAITESVGLGRPAPVNRGKAPEKKVYDDTTLSRIRHKEFRTAPDNTAFIQAFNQILDRESRLFWHKNKRLCQELMYEIQDLKTYAMCWATTFAHRGQIMGEETDNAKLLTVYLRQRFTELFKSLRLERAKCLPSTDGTEQPWDMPEAFAEVEEHTAIPRATRRAAASEALEEGLAGMDHDRLVSALENASKGPLFGARRLASKKLGQHRESCESCKAGALKAGE
jgi:hypothetical protein